MRRLPAAAAAITALALVPSAAGAKIIEIGATPNPFVPACPAAPCLVIDRTTGYQAKVGTNRGLMTVPQNGRIVAWTIGLSQPSAAQIKYFETHQQYGVAQAGISVLTVGKHLHDVVKSAGPLVKLDPYFGSTTQFPLPTSLPVRKGDLIALTVPTWAPALQVGLGNDTSWRAARLKNKCKSFDTQTAQLQIGSKAQYYCLYRTARLAYSATLVTAPQVTNKTKAKKATTRGR
jgi:hypothetical protein